MVLTLLELVSTVRNYLASHITWLRPFLYIGIISATRRILAIGVQSTLDEEKATTSFEHLMVDLAVNGGVVLALAGALFLFGRERKDTAALGDARDTAEESEPFA